MVMILYQLDRSAVSISIFRTYYSIHWIYWFVASGSITMSRRRSLLSLKDAIVILRFNMKRRFNAHIIITSSLDYNMLRISFVSSIVYYMTAALTSSIENIVLICCSVL